MDQDPYTTLGLSPNAGQEDVKRAFRRLALEFHPDRHTTDSEHVRAAAAARFKAITRAYEVLSDERRRTASSARASTGAAASSSYPHADSSYYYSGRRPRDASAHMYPGIWRRMQQSFTSGAHANRVELLIVGLVTLVGVAGVGFSDRLMRERDKERVCSPVVVRPYTAGHSRAGIATPTQNNLASLTLAEILALEEAAERQEGRSAPG